MDLFDQLAQQPHNLLPQQGIVYYYGSIMPQAEADKYFAGLMQQIAWQHDQLMMSGKLITTQRKVAWYGDQPFCYRYSQTTKTALPWIPLLLTLKRLVEHESGEHFNSCLLNLYHNGSEGMSWHSDAEQELQRDGAIGSLSLGAARYFAFKHNKTKQTIKQHLAHGSLLVMKGTTQNHWQHCLPPTKLVDTPRINLTFRCIA